MSDKNSVRDTSDASTRLVLCGCGRAAEYGIADDENPWCGNECAFRSLPVKRATAEGPPPWKEIAGCGKCWSLRSSEGRIIGWTVDPTCTDHKGRDSKAAPPWALDPASAPPLCTCCDDPEAPDCPVHEPERATDPLADEYARAHSILAHRSQDARIYAYDNLVALVKRAREEGREHEADRQRWQRMLTSIYEELKGNRISAAVTRLELFRWDATPCASDLITKITEPDSATVQEPLPQDPARGGSSTPRPSGRPEDSATSSGAAPNACPARVDIAKARKAAQRLIDVAFGNRDERGERIRPNFQIPATPTDDDLILSQALDELEALRGTAGRDEEAPSGSVGQR